MNRVTSGQTRKCILFQSEELLPAEWDFMLGLPLWMFNPAILRRGEEWILAYRVVSVDQVRRLATCRLDKDFRVVPHSQVPFSDRIPYPADFPAFRPWYADPRLYVLGGKVYLYWNSGWHDPQNEQYLIELHPESLTPLGFPRRFNLADRRPLEKNWSIFGDGPFFAVYSIQPHRILQFTIDAEGPLQFSERSNTSWDAESYENRFGPLRGGAPPIRIGAEYYSFCHTLVSGTEGVTYLPAVYTFSAENSFAPKRLPVAPLELGNPFGSQTLEKRLNPAVKEVIYPCGAAHLDNQFVISYGINDEHCAIAIIPAHEVEAILTGL